MQESAGAGWRGSCWNWEGGKYEMEKKEGRTWIFMDDRADGGVILRGNKGRDSK
jgi:hypothetical protein